MGSYFSSYIRLSFTIYLHNCSLQMRSDCDIFLNFAILLLIAVRSDYRIRPVYFVGMIDASSNSFGIITVILKDFFQVRWLKGLDEGFFHVFIRTMQC